LLLVLVGLGAYIYWAVPESDSAPDVDHVFEALEPNSVVELTLTTSAGDVTNLEKDGEDWRIAAPVTAPASSSEASSLTRTLESLELVRVVEEDPTGLDQYGLDSPQITIEFRSTQEGRSGKLIIGDQTPTGDNLYAMREGESQIFLIPSFQKSSFERSTFDLRDKSVVKFARDRVTGVTVEQADSRFQLDKRDGAWTLTQPVGARADNGTIEGLVGRLETTQMKSVVADEATPDDLQEYGLDSPVISITLDGTDASLLVGNDASDEEVYAKDAAGSVIFTVETSLADDLRRGANEYRRRDMFDFRAYNATRAEFTRDGQTVVFEQVPADGDDAQDTWRRVSPAPADVERSAIDTLLVGLVDIRAVEFVNSTENTGLGLPILSVFVAFEDGQKEERVVFGRQGDEVYASRPDDAGAALVDSEKVDEVIKRLEELIK
jgi:hypothetical protein